MNIKKIFLTSFIINLILIIVFFILEYTDWIINLEFAYFTSGVVIYLSFFSYKSKIRETLQNYEIPKNTKEDEDDIEIDKYKTTISTFVSVYRVFGYILLILGFFYLLKNNFFIHIPYFMGLTILPLAIILSIFTSL